MNIPSLPLAELADAAIDFLVETCAPFTRAGAEVVSALLDIFEHGLLACLGCSFLFYAASHGC